MDDLISRQAAIDAATKYGKQLNEILGDENELAETVKILKHRIIALPSAQPGEWLENYVSAILQAGLEGREVSFKVGDRTFVVREVRNDTRKSDC